MSDDDSDYEPFGSGEDYHADDDGFVTDPSMSGAEEEDDNYLGDDVDVDGLLQRMGAATGDGDSAPQAYQILRARHDRSKSKQDRNLRGPAASGGGADTADGAEDADWATAQDLELGATSEPRQKQKKKKSKKRGGTRQIELPEHVSRMMGHANLLYASNKHQQAIDLLLEVIRSVPNLADPYNTLGTLHETLGKHREALNFYMIAAHMTGNDVGLWHKLATMSTEHGYIRQAIYCWSKFLSKHRDDFEACFSRAQLYSLIQEGWKAKGQFQQLLEKEPGHPEVVKELARLYNEEGDPNAAIELLETQLRDHYDKLDLTHINMLADLYINLGHNDNAVQLINRTEEVFCSHGDLPIDLAVRRGICYLNMGDQSSATADLQKLLDHAVEEEEVSYLDLYRLVVEQACKAGFDKLAVAYMDKIREAPHLLEDATDWQLVIDGYCRAEQHDVAIEMYKQKLQELGHQDERYFPTALSLARLYVDVGQTSAATNFLAQLDEQLSQGAITLPEGRGLQLSLFIAKGSMHLKLGQKEEFAACLLPHYTTLLQLAENNAAIVTAANKASSSGAVDKELVLALKRRKMYARKGGRKGEGAVETESVFQGYVSRDRRKPHVAKADQAAEQLLRRARAAGVRSGAMSGAEDTDFEADDDQTQQQDLGDLPADLQALVAAVTADQHEIPDMFNLENTQLYGSFCDLVRVLLELGQNSAAESLLKRAQAVSAFSAKSKDTTAWWGPSGLAGNRAGSKKAKSQPGAASDGNVSDWAPSAPPASSSSGPGAAERREHVRKAREGIRLMQAEVLCKQGKIEEALKSIKTVLPKWPYSWRAWSLYCCVAGQAGRVQHWMRTVAALRAKHPDSLPLQVLAAHADNISGDQEPACQGYASALMHLPNEPLLMLCLGAAQIDAALARHCRDRNTALLRGFAALHTYAQHRGHEAEAEAAYNLGRAAHQVGLLHLAVAHYERVLQIDAEAAAAEQAAAAVHQLQDLQIQQQQQPDALHIDGSEDHHQQQQQQQDDQQAEQRQLHHHHQQQQQQLKAMGRYLVKEAAHNLCLIYKGSGADVLARQIMRRYLTV